MNLEIETLQLELPVHETKRALRIVDLIKEALSRMPPLPIVERDIRIAALIVDEIRLIPGAPDAEIAAAVVAGIYRALVQAINSAGTEARSAMGPVPQTPSPEPEAARPSTNGKQDIPPDGPETRVEYQLSDPTLNPPRPVPGPRVPKLELISFSDLAEYDLLKGKIADQHGKPLKSAREYLGHRRKIFGSDAEYAAEGEIADREFDTLAPKDLIHVWGETLAAKKLIYRWARRGYLRRGLTEPIDVVRRHETPELRRALENAERAAGKFRQGQFLVRPEKLAPAKKLLLGTVSKHGTGDAVDVNDTENPTLSPIQWAHIETVTGKAVDRSKERWQKHPADLWKDINDLSVSFSKLRHEEILKDLRKKNADPNIISLHVEWADGFFHLSRDLVLAFHDQGLTWGSTFDDQVDLHHFELP